ncbi:uncharacterized protein LOC116299638 [Actinia tenebrosa]|uniref:Uncharacterized protein LOC116299638 n=1 Tax=Actinia tenebrosa TaxID=6105 RepID=A0A6P8I828_ACTTE|nr:uncharacterized protein LOC116299638 [Actinia tenebrosa]XP_031564187.1 uncharacterized protein LOC116299638 [Actinia tenebrosa]XP_031564188.1 uncharacterized protein LOC116299638 [Actinia tenebrosa]XP_031564189.1 uncharacterized protein LOC116299638 [Actinia tenebrosa]XP_031564190.1 uncharacterized protein LOC116299638 [Actinia tenebrosa]XP_031564191.1 uncharacterized protein LOC116299638 [Actinia tenebrosa]XP_031564193.1 uncharacterized protein LOC116299638 [Actinia tenebrosa]XP_03156419
MEDTSERKFPPRSKFNDEEATAVLRLIIEQEKLLKNANTRPLLNISANRLQRLPPLNAKRSESLDENELENVRTRKPSGHREPGSEIFLKPTLLKGKDSRSLSDNVSLPGKPRRVPDIYSTPKIVKPHRDRERPKGSYGRNNALRKDINNELTPLENHSDERQLETEVQRSESNGCHKDATETEDNTFSPIHNGYISDHGLYERPNCPAPAQYSPPSYIN